MKRFHLLSTRKAPLLSPLTITLEELSQSGLSNAHPRAKEGKELLFSFCFLMKFTLSVFQENVSSWDKLCEELWIRLRRSKFMINEESEWAMAESPSRHLGFGSSGKSFLIDNLLRPDNKLASAQDIPAASQKRCLSTLVCGPLELAPKSWVPLHGAHANNSPQEMERETLKTHSGRMAYSHLYVGRRI